MSKKTERFNKKQQVNAKSTSKAGKAKKVKTLNNKKASGKAGEAGIPTNYSKMVCKKAFEMIDNGIPINAVTQYNKPCIKGWNKQGISKKQFRTLQRQNSSLAYIIICGLAVKKNGLFPEGSKLVVLDLDCKKLVKKFFKQFPKLKDAYYVKSRRGVHIYFLLDPSEKLPVNCSEHGNSDYDFLSKGKGAIGEGSIHYKTGNPYKAFNTLDDILPWSKWGEKICSTIPGWNEKQNKSKSKSKSTISLSSKKTIAKIISQGAAEGSRNTTAYTLAKACASKHIPLSEAEKHMQQFCKNCKPEFDLDEAFQTLNSVYKDVQESSDYGYSYVNGKGLTNYIEADKLVKPPVSFDVEDKIPLKQYLESKSPDFPIECLDKSLRLAIIESIKANNSCSANLAAVAFLGAVSCAMYKGFQLELKPSHKLFGNLYIIIAVISNGCKSYIFKIVQKPFTEAVKIYEQKFQEELKESKSEKELINTQISQIKDKMKKAEESDLKKLNKELKSLTLERDSLNSFKFIPFKNNATTQAMTLYLFENAEQGVIIDADAKGIIDLVKGTNKKCVDVSIFLKAYSGDSEIKDTVSRGTECLFEPIISILLATQVKPLVNELLPYPPLQGLGFNQRFLIYLDTGSLDENSLSYSRHSFNPKVMKKYVNTMLKIIDHSVKCAKGSKKIVTSKITPEALDIYDEFYQELSAKELGLVDDPELATAYSKLKDMAPKVALNLKVYKAFANKKPVGDICAETMASAVKIMRFFMANTENAYALSRKNKNIALAEKVYKWCCEKRMTHIFPNRREEGHGKKFIVKPGEIQKYNVGGIQEVNQAIAALNKLVEHNYAQEVNFKNTRKPTAPVSKMYWLRPPENK